MFLSLHLSAHTRTPGPLCAHVASRLTFASRHHTSTLVCVSACMCAGLCHHGGQYGCVLAHLTQADAHTSAGVLVRVSGDPPHVCTCQPAHPLAATPTVIQAWAALRASHVYTSACSLSGQGQEPGPQGALRAAGHSTFLWETQREPCPPPRGPRALEASPLRAVGAAGAHPGGSPTRRPGRPGWLGSP